MTVCSGGAAAIAEEIGRTLRQTFYMLEVGRLPAEKVGRLWVTTPRRLRNRLVGEVTPSSHKMELALGNSEVQSGKCE